VWPLGSVHGQIGRGVAAQPVTALAVVGDGSPLVDPMVWSVDRAGPLAVMSGSVDGKPTVEVYDIDAGTQLWRASCGAPVVGVTRQIILCGDANGVHSLDWYGKPGWTSPSPFVAMDGPRLIVGEGSVVDAATGAEQFAVALPAGARAMAACDHELFAVLADHRFARFTTKLAWALALAKTDEIVSVDACDPTTPILAIVAGEHGTALVAIGRDGKLLGRIDDVRGTWTARDDEHAIEVATSTAVTRWDRALSVGQPLELPVLGAAIAKRGDRRLVRATSATAALIDRHGVRAYVVLGESSAALGDDHILAGLRWFGLPRPWTQVLRTTQSGPVMVPAELRDLPPPVTPVLANAPELALGTKLSGIAIAGTQLYAATDAGIAQLDLATLRWGWHVALDARAIAATTDIVVVATATSTVGFAPDGTKRWERPGTGALELAGGAVLVGSTVLDAATGASLGAVTSPATVLAFDETTLVVTYERNRVVARVPSVRMLPAWSVEVAGVVTSLQRAGDGVLVALDNGDAYRIDARTGDAVAIAGIGLVWRAVGDAVTGEAPGGPIPGVIKRPVTTPELYKPTDLEAAPAIATPWPPPPPMAASWQLTVYDLGGGLRTRNDYAFTSPMPALRVGPAPFVYISGHDALVLDPVHGDPLRRVALPETGVAFSTIVDGRAVVGTILAAPLRVVVF
jgi:outer membrane protein assembly factor BamB